MSPESVQRFPDKDMRKIKKPKAADLCSAARELSQAGHAG
jgi:hypothetical protein